MRRRAGQQRGTRAIPSPQSCSISSMSALRLGSPPLLPTAVEAAAAPPPPAPPGRRAPTVPTPPCTRAGRADAAWPPKRLATSRPKKPGGCGCCERGCGGPGLRLPVP